jgi:hypothetical protein
VTAREREFAAARSRDWAEREWLADSRNAAWLDEIDAAIDTGDLERLALAQEALRRPPGARGPLPGPRAPRSDVVAAQAATAVPFRQVPASVVEDVQLPEPTVEPVTVPVEVPAAQPAPSGRKLLGAFARRAQSQGEAA